ncbi:MAG: alpha/beta hydrolase family protein [Alkalilacustris sp.]
MRALVLAALLMPAAVAAQSPAAGLQEVTIPAPHHGRSLALALWYPARPDAPTEAFAGNPVFHPVAVARDGAALPGPHPVVLLSHGLGGHYRSLAWLAAGLAEAGAVVIAVNHPNSTFGDLDLARGMAHWTRAADLTAALDHAAADPELAPLLDLSEVAAVGFSYGGWTALQLGGVRGHLAGFAAHCAESIARDRHCADLAAGGVDLAAFDPAEWDAPHSDPRITRVVAIDPALTWRLSPAHVAGLDAETLLIQLGAELDRLPATDIGPDGSGVTALLPRTRVLEIAPAAHFSVLPLCTSAGAALLEEDGDDPVCTDPAGAERADIHEQVLAAAAAFLDLN